jgi:hypothetical protein
MARHLTPDEHKARLALADQGLSTKQIATLEGVGFGSVHAWALRHKIKLAKDMDAKAKHNWGRCFDAGMTAGAAAKALGSNKFHALKWAEKRGLVWPESDGLTEAQRADVRVLVEKGSYSTPEALAIVTRPKVKVPLRVPKAACEVRA